MPPAQAAAENSTEAEKTYTRDNDLWTGVFFYVDWVFISIFVIELCIKLYAWGPVTYMRNLLDCVDAIVVTISFVFLVVFASIGFEEGDDSMADATARTVSSASASSSASSSPRVLA